MSSARREKRDVFRGRRDVIRRGAEMLGWELDRLLEDTIAAMRPDEAHIAETVAALG